MGKQRLDADDSKVRCEDCNGWGTIISSELEQCYTCRGKGVVSKSQVKEGSNAKT